MILTQAQKNELAHHLVDEGVADESAGYGHADGAQVAEVVAKWLATQPDYSVPTVSIDSRYPGRLHPTNVRDNWGRIS